MTGAYPDAPGWKGQAETGRDAAGSVQSKVGRLQRMVLTTLARNAFYGSSAEEAADANDVDRVSIQPRFSELRAKGLIVDSGRRRRNPSSGKSAVVWVLPEYASAKEVAV